MNNIGAQIGDILGTVATILILSLPFVLIFFIVRNVLALKREMNETKQLEAARAAQQRKEVLQRQAELEEMESADEELTAEEEENPEQDEEDE